MAVGLAPQIWMSAESMNIVKGSGRVSAGVQGVLLSKRTWVQE